MQFNLCTIFSTFSTVWPDLRSLLLGADGTLSVHRCVGTEDPLCQIDEGVVPIADSQALGLEQDAGLPIVGHTQRAIGPHQRLEQLPLIVGHPRLVPAKGLQRDGGRVMHKSKLNQYK